MRTQTCFPAAAVSTLNTDTPALWILLWSSSSQAAEILEARGSRMGESSIPVKVGDINMEDDCPSIPDQKVQYAKVRCTKYNVQGAFQYIDSHRTSFLPLQVGIIGGSGFYKLESLEGAVPKQVIPCQPPAHSHPTAIPPTGDHPLGQCQCGGGHLGVSVCGGAGQVCHSPSGPNHYPSPFLHQTWLLPLPAAFRGQLQGKHLGPQVGWQKE